MFLLNPKKGTWTRLASNGTKPLARSSMGFISTPDGMIYLFGGNSIDGSSGEELESIP
jgi:hypothetical protein